MAKLKVVRNYGVIPNDILNDKNISLKAKGLFVFIQSKPETWSFSAKRIASQTKDSPDGVTTALKELEDAGLLVRRRYQDVTGFWLVEYTLFESADKENPEQVFPDKENPSTGKTPNISKKDNSKKEYSNKEDSSEQSSQDSSAIVSIIKEFESVDIANAKSYNNTTQRTACKDLLEHYELDAILKVIRLLPKTNKKPRYEFPYVNTPQLLFKNWKKLEDGFHALKEKSEKYKVI